ncbi:MmcQ/YjbR family DNA-binding protein [Paenibacillus nasutitermitis]|nr:MmcQ/YjbR family DNA-binding protein [Paenibacillus nasutitermitis]
MEWITEYCFTRPGAVKDFPFGKEPMVMKVGGKMFALLSGQAISLKCDPVVAENLREQNEAITPGYHLNKKHWNSIRIDGSLSADEIRSMIDHSYDLVFKGLPKAVREKVRLTVG